MEEAAPASGFLFSPIFPALHTLLGLALHLLTCSDPFQEVSHPPPRPPPPVHHCLPFPATLLTYGLSAPPTRPAVPSSLPCSPHRCLSVTDSGLRSKAAPHSLSRAHPVCCSLSLQDSTSLVSSDLSCPSVICLCSPSSPWRKLPTHRPSVTSSEVLCRAWIQMLCISQLSCCGRIPQTPDLKQQVHFLTVLEAGSPRSRCCQG